MHYYVLDEAPLYRTLKSLWIFGKMADERDVYRAHLIFHYANEKKGKCQFLCVCQKNCIWILNKKHRHVFVFRKVTCTCSNVQLYIFSTVVNQVFTVVDLRLLRDCLSLFGWKEYSYKHSRRSRGAGGICTSPAKICTFCTSASNKVS